MFSRYASLCVAVGSLVAGSAVAADSGWYIGGGVGSVSSDIGPTDANGVRDTTYFIRSIGAIGGTAEVDDSTEAWSVMAGYRFSPNFAVEVAYLDLGEVTYRYRGEVGGGGMPSPFPVIPPTPIIDPVETDIEWENTVVSAKVIGRLPVGDRFDVHGHAGLASTMTDASASTRIGGTRSTSFTMTDDSDSTNLTYGVGAAFNLHERVSLSLDWQRYETSEDDEVRLDIDANYDVISLSLLFRLGAVD